MDENTSCHSQAQIRIISWVENLQTPLPFSRKRKLDDRDPVTSQAEPCTKHTLRSASGNIMSSSEGAKRNQKIGLRRSSRKRNTDTTVESQALCITPRKATRINVAQDQDNQVDEPAPRPPVPAEQPVNSMAPPFSAGIKPPSPSGSSTSSASGIRSASPAKTTADLRMAQRPTYMEILNSKTARASGGVLTEYRELHMASQGIGVIPYSLKTFIQDHLDPEVWPNDRAFEEPDPDTGTEKADRVLGEEALIIHRRAIECTREELSEAEWNCRVQSPLLQLIEDQPKHKGAVKHFNITTARIQPQNLLSMIHASGAKMQDKMVDYAMALHPNPSMENQIRKLLLKQDASSVNQIFYPPLCFRPAFLHIETKAPFMGGRGSDVQLAIWVAAGFKRTRLFLENQGRRGEKLPTMPMLSMHRHELYFSAFEEREDHNVVYRKLRLGSTDSLLGIFQIISGVDVLVQWADREYRRWYVDTVLADCVA